MRLPIVAPVRPRTVSTGEEEEKSAKVPSRAAGAASGQPGHPNRRAKQREQRTQPRQLVPSSSLTIRDHDASYHGSKHNSQCQSFEPQRGHVTPCSEGAVLLLKRCERETELSSCITTPQLLSSYPSRLQQLHHLHAMVSTEESTGGALRHG